MHTESQKTQTESQDNPFKAAAQLRKAIKLADVLTLVSATQETIKDEPTRRLAEQLAGVSQSSDTTWAMVSVLIEPK